MELKKTDKNVCIAMSGGLDSTTLVHELVRQYGKDRVIGVAFNYGQRHTIELEKAQQSADRLGIKFEILDLLYMKDMNKNFSSLVAGSDLKPKTAEENAGNPTVNTYIAFRNMQFASITASYAEVNNCDLIFQGLNAVDEYGYWDTSLEFTKRINNVLQLNRSVNIEFVAPFVEMFKVDELLVARKLSAYFGYDILEFTWSCYNGANESGKECGLCNTCEEKLTGYVQAGYSNEEILNQFNVTDERVNELRDLIL